MFSPTPKYKYTGNYCWQPKYHQTPRFLTVFGLPTSNTEYCQIPQNTIWELALKYAEISITKKNYLLEKRFLIKKENIRGSWKKCEAKMPFGFGVLVDLNTGEPSQLKNSEIQLREYKLCVKYSSQCFTQSKKSLDLLH